MDLQMISAFSDNYLYAFDFESTCVVVDPGSADEVLMHPSCANIDYILCTHHHADHIGGIHKIKSQMPECKVIGFEKEAKRIPQIDIFVSDQQILKIGNLEIKVIYTPGHTLGHICYYIEQLKLLFCGDTLFSLGCGRLFEGTASQMFESLQKLAALPDETKVCCAHEYTLANAKFLESLGNLSEAQHDFIREVKNLRAQGLRTIPSTIGKEKLVNPFLRAKTVEEFAELRGKKDVFPSS